MCGTAICVVMMAVGIDVGWEPLPGGGVEYIIQIEPEMLDTLRDGEDLGSDIPSGLDVRSYRIVVGTGKLPRRKPAEPATAPKETPTSKTPEPTANLFNDPFFGSSKSSGSPSDSSPSDTPGKLPPDTSGKPLAHQQVTFEKPTLGNVPKTSQTPAGVATAEEQAKPWWALTMALVILFGSLGGNLYLCWIAFDARGRYRGLLVKYLALSPGGESGE